MKKLFLLTAVLMTCSNFMTVANAAEPNRNDGPRPPMDDLCKGKAPNSKVTVTHGDRTMQGVCQIGFKAANPQDLGRGGDHRGHGPNPQNNQICQGKKIGQPITATINGKKINGKCDVVFKPNMR